MDKIESIVIVAKFNDGKCRQVLLKTETEAAVLQTIVCMESNVRVLETPLETIDIE